MRMESHSWAEGGRKVGGEKGTGSWLAGNYVAQAVMGRLTFI